MNLRVKFEKPKKTDFIKETNPKFEHEKDPLNWIMLRKNLTKMPKSCI